MPKPGEILLWPAFLTHFVHPNLSETPRISISFNAVLKRSDAYLPSQD
jgi:Putative 2OG-Fe(II) oxygenase